MMVAWAAALLVAAVPALAADAVPASSASAQGSWVAVRGDARDLAITTGGDVLALDRDGAVWWLSAEAIAAGQWDAWTSRPGAFVRLRATPDGRVWGISAEAWLYRLDGSVWNPVAPHVADVTASPDGEVTWLTDDGGLALPAEGRTIQAPANAPRPGRLVSDVHGELWLVSSDGRALRRRGGQWQAIEPPAEPIRDLSIGPQGSVLAATESGRLLQRLPQTGRWAAYGTDLAAPPGVSRVVLGQADLPWVIAGDGRLYVQRVGTHATPWPGPSAAVFTRLLRWQPVGGLAKEVGVAPDGTVFSLATDGAAWQWQGGNRWAPVGGNFVALAVGSRGTLWGLNAEGSIYAWRQGVWSGLPGQARRIAAGPTGTLWAASNDDRLMTWNGAAGAWEAVADLPPTVRALAIDEAGLPWVIDADGTVQWRIAGRWSALPGVAASSLAVGPLGTVYAVAADDGGIHWLDRAQAQWRPVSGSASAIAVGPAGAPWIVAPGQVLMVSQRFLDDAAERDEAEREAAAAVVPPAITVTLGRLPTLRKALDYQTVQMPGVEFQSVGVSINGAVYALNSDGVLSCFSNAGKRFLEASQSKAQRVAVAPSGAPWLLSVSGIVSRFEKGAWQGVNDFIGADLSVGPDGQAMALDNDGTAYRYVARSNRFVAVPVTGADAPFRAIRIAAAQAGVYWVVADGGRLLRCAANQCSTKWQGVREVAVAPDYTVFALDLLGTVRRLNPANGQFEPQNGQGVAIAVGPQGLPWLVTAAGRVVYAGLFFPTSRTLNTETCADEFRKSAAPPEVPTSGE